MRPFEDDAAAVSAWCTANGVDEHGTMFTPEEAVWYSIARIGRLHTGDLCVRCLLLACTMRDRLAVGVDDYLWLRRHKMVPDKHKFLLRGKVVIQQNSVRDAQPCQCSHAYRIR